MAAGVALGIGHDADRHPEPALGQAGDSLDLRIIQRIERAIGVHAHGVDRGLMTSGIGAGGVCGIGNDGISAGGGDQRHVRHVIDGELAQCLALGDALGEQAGRDPMRRRHAVTDEQDDILRLARTRGVDVPGDLAGLDAVRHLDFVAARLRERNIAQEQSRLLLAVLALDESCGLAERLGVVLAVDGDGHTGRIGKTGKFDFEIEARAGQKFGTIDRVDRLRKTCRSSNRNRKEGGG